MGMVWMEYGRGNHARQERRKGHKSVFDMQTLALHCF